MNAPRSQANRARFAELLGMNYEPGAPMWLCDTCRRALENDNIPSTASDANHMRLSYIPVELQDLTVMETRLISQVRILARISLRRDSANTAELCVQSAVQVPYTNVCFISAKSCAMDHSLALKVRIHVPGMPVQNKRHTE